MYVMQPNGTMAVQQTLLPGHAEMAVAQLQDTGGQMVVSARTNAKRKKVNSALSEPL